MTPSTHVIRIVFNINAVQYQTGPIHESDDHIFAKIPGGVRTPGHTLPHPSGSAHAQEHRMRVQTLNCGVFDKG